MAPHAGLRTGLLYAAALLMATPAFGQQAAQGDTARAPQADVTPGTAGQQVAIDPQTGRLRAVTPEEARALVAALTSSLSQSDAGLVPVRLPNGVVTLDLDGRFESAAMAKLAADGSIDAECVTSVEELKHFLGLDTPAAGQDHKTTTPKTPVLEER